MDVEPSEAMTSEFTRTVYGKSSSGGNTASRAFSARVPKKLEKPAISYCDFTCKQNRIKNYAFYC